MAETFAQLLAQIADQHAREKLPAPVIAADPTTAHMLRNHLIQVIGPFVATFLPGECDDNTIAKYAGVKIKVLFSEPRPRPLHREWREHFGVLAELWSDPDLEFIAGEQWTKDQIVEMVLQRRAELARQRKGVK